MPNEAEYYTPDLGSIRDWYAGAVDEYMCDTGMSRDEAEAAFDRAIAAHDRALREQIAQKIEVEMWRPERLMWLVALLTSAVVVLVVEAAMAWQTGHVSGLVLLGGVLLAAALVQALTGAEEGLAVTSDGEGDDANAVRRWARLDDESAALDGDRIPLSLAYRTAKKEGDPR